MTRSEQKFNKAIEILKKEYIKSQASVYVAKPMAYALYQTWKYFDGHEGSRIANENNRK